MSSNLVQNNPAFSRTQLRVIERLVHGDSERHACVKSGLPYYHPERFVTDEMRAEVVKISALLAEKAREKCLADAGEIHEFLSDAFRARMSDIRNDDHTFKPRSEWPEIWDRLEESGEVEITYESQRSHDGEDTDGLGGWEKTGRTVEKVKLKFGSRVKLVELLMKHKAVDAMVQQGDKLAGAVGELASSIDKAIAEGRQRASQRNRLPD